MSDPLRRVRSALGVGDVPRTAPVIPPQMDEPVVRLVHAEFGLSELLVGQARQAGSTVHTPRVDELVETLFALLGEKDYAVVVPSKLLKQDLNLVGVLRSRDVDVSWVDARGEMRPQSVLIFDAEKAVAETGTVATSSSAALVASRMIAVVQPRVIVPDMLDLALSATNIHLLTGAPVALLVLS